MSKIFRFTTEAVTLNKNIAGGRGEVATPFGGGFTDYALVSLHCLRIYLDESYRGTLDFLSEMPHILTEIGFEKDDLSDHSKLVDSFYRFRMKVWRVLLRLSAQLHRVSGRATIDITFSTAKTQASKHYNRLTN